jgi:hypothetical protein
VPILNRRSQNRAIRLHDHRQGPPSNERASMPTVTRRSAK